MKTWKTCSHKSMFVCHWLLSFFLCFKFQMYFLPLLQEVQSPFFNYYKKKHSGHQRTARDICGADTQPNSDFRPTLVIHMAFGTSYFVLLLKSESQLCRFISKGFKPTFWSLTCEHSLPCVTKRRKVAPQKTSQTVTLSFFF